MAVVQISKIQVRRGRKNSGSGLPQLASGELAWAIDTQELYIGNGAVGEGAPYVGNTKVLTEHDNILELAFTYQYKYDSSLQQSLINGSVKRSLQNRLDDGSVNARNFNIKPISELIIGEQSDQTLKIQTAINELAGENPVDLVFDPGEYQITQTITLPSNVRIKGFGKNITIFRFDNPAINIVFDTEEDSENISLEDFTIRTTSNNKTLLKINNSKNCNFNSIKFIFDDGSPISIPLPGVNDSNAIKGIEIIGYGDISSNKFRNLEFKRLSYGIRGKSRTSFNTFDNCLFEYLYQGIELGNTGLNSDYNIISNSIFDKITLQALIVNVGTGNKSNSNTYKDVGTDISGRPTVSVIKFLTDGNTSSNDVFERKELLELDNSVPLKPYIAEIEGVVSTQGSQPRQITLPYTINSLKAFNLPLNFGDSFKIDYIFKSKNLSNQVSQIRKGTLHIVVDKINDRVQLVDEYEFIGNNPTDENLLIFTATISTTDTNKEILEVNYKNLILNETNTFTYNYSVISIDV